MEEVIPTPIEDVTQVPTEQPSAKNKSGKSLILVSIGAVILLVLGISAYVLGFNKNRSQADKPQTVGQQKTIIPSTTAPSEVTKFDPKITDLIAFKLLPGWTQKVTDTDVPGFAGSIIINSSDLVNNSSFGKLPAVNMAIQVSMDGKSQTFDKKYKDLSDQMSRSQDNTVVTHNLTKTTVAGYPAVSYYIDYPPDFYSRYYYVWNGDYLWYIRIDVQSPATQEQYKNEINSIVSSIQFMK